MKLNKILLIPTIAILAFFYLPPNHRPNPTKLEMNKYPPVSSISSNITRPFAQLKSVFNLKMVAINSLRFPRELFSKDSKTIIPSRSVCRF